MPLRPELPPGLGLPRRGEVPMRAPRLNFPMVGDGAPETGPGPANGPVLVARDCTRVIVYGKAGSQACLEMIQDLIDRQVCFTYHDVSRDEQAMVQLQAICGDASMLPVVIQIGVRGA